ncbi:hypothetical protein D9M70_524850 [compost metagenome]
MLVGDCQQAVQLFIRHGVITVDQPLHRAAHESGWPTNRQAVRCRDIVDAELLDTDFIVQPGVHAQQHAGGVSGLGEEAVHGIAKGQLEAEGHASGAAPHTTRQVDEQRVIQVDDHSSLLELAHQSFCSDCVAKEQMGRVLVVHKVAGGVACSLPAPLLHRDAVVRLVLNDRHPICSQLFLLPLARIR